MRPQLPKNNFEVNGSYALGLFKIKNVESKIALVGVILVPFSATLSSDILTNFSPLLHFI